MFGKENVYGDKTFLSKHNITALFKEHKYVWKPWRAILTCD